MCVCCGGRVQRCLLEALGSTQDHWTSPILSGEVAPHPKAPGLKPQRHTPHLDQRVMTCSQILLLCYCSNTDAGRPLLEVPPPPHMTFC